jgi:hypothetical protein
MADLRGELRCFACSRYLGDFESHPAEHGPKDLHLLKRDYAIESHAVATPAGLRCSRCGGRVVAAYVELAAA